MQQKGWRPITAPVQKVQDAVRALQTARGRGRQVADLDAHLPGKAFEGAVSQQHRPSRIYFD